MIIDDNFSRAKDYIQTYIVSTNNETSSALGEMVLSYYKSSCMIEKDIFKTF